MKIFQLSTILFILTTFLWIHKAKETQKELNEQRKLVEVEREKVNRYRTIAYKIDSICDIYQSSRRAKQRNEELLNLSMGL